MNSSKQEIFYKSRQSYENQHGFFRSYFNQVRKDKESKYKKVDTRKFDYLIQEMNYYNDMEYICAGLNSFEREVVVIDCDDTDRGERTLKLLKMAHLEPHFMKIKPNGHSQFYFFIQKFYIGESGFDNGKYYENNFHNEHYQWKWLTRMMNVLFNGDVGYTGYNCQNPFYKDAEVYEFHSLNDLYSVDFLCKRINHFLAQPETLSYVNETICKFYSERKQNKNKTKKILKKIHFIDEEEAERLAEESREELRQKLAKIMQNKSLTNQAEVQNIIDEIIKTSDDSINKRIFVLCSKICKSFWSRGLLHNPEHNDEIIRTCLSNWYYEDYAEGYTTYELVQRIRHDIYCIQQKDIHNTMLWNKVGYTNIQREKSLKTRRIKMTLKRNRIKSIYFDNEKSFTKRGMSLNGIIHAIVLKYTDTYNESISYSTVRNYLIKYYKNKVFYIKTHKDTSKSIKIKNYSAYTHSHNNKLKTIQRESAFKTRKRVITLIRLLYEGFDTLKNVV